jgi:hypothetical protein
MLSINTAQANINARTRCNRPWKTPAIAVEHRQSPQIHWMLINIPIKHIRNGIDCYASMVVHHTLWIASSA